MNRFSNRCLFIAAAMLLLIVTACWAGQERSWPAWRKNGLGITQATGLPIVWDTETNIAWSAEIEGQGNSSPIIWDNKLFITTATNDSKTRSILCYDINSGKRLWQKDYTVEKVAPTYKKNGYASSTACTDGQRVYVFFDDPGIVALDFNGHEQWVTSLGPFKTIWGFASSPAVCQGKLIVVCDQDGQSFIGAFDVASGKEIWRTNRDTGRAYSSPYIFEDQGSKQIIVNGETIYAYDFQTGQELWKCISTKDMITPTAISHNGLVYISQGRNGPTVVVDPSGRGDISDTHVQMRMNTGGPYVPCPLFYPALFLPGDNGLYQFVDQNGKVILKDRIKAHFSASPLAGDNKIYWGSEEGDVYVMDVSKVLDEQPSVTILSVNHMGESVLASPAVCGKNLFIRTVNHLYCVVPGQKTTTKKREKATMPDNMEALTALYDQHKAQEEGPSILIRLDVVTAMAKTKDPAALPMLKQIVLKDNHWDVCEEADKLLLTFGEAAIPYMIQIIEEAKTWESWKMIIACDNLGKLKAIQGISSMLKLAEHGDFLVRIAALSALSEIAAVHPQQRDKILLAILQGLQDERGEVRQVAVDCCLRLIPHMADQHQAFKQRIKSLQSDENIIVRKKAQDVLDAHF